MLNDPDTAATKEIVNEQPSQADVRAMSPLKLPPNLKFGPFQVNSQVFHISPANLSFGLVNLKPLLPGHILVCPIRSVPRLSQLTAAETSDLFLTVQRISKTLERVYHAEALNVAVQDGVEAGQSVPHVHVHVIPRVRKDMESKGGSDAIYDLMDREEGNYGDLFVKMYRRRKEREAMGREIGGPDADDKRMPRSEEEMKAEADWLREEVGNDRHLGEADNVDTESS